MNGPGQERRPSGMAALGIALVALGGYLLLREYVPFIPGFDFVRELWRDLGWPLAIIAVGAALIVGARRTGFALPSSSQRLYRSEQHKMLAGVLGGLGEYFGADPTLVRLLYVVFALLTDIGTALLIYVVLAVIVPKRSEAGGVPS